VADISNLAGESVQGPIAHDSPISNHKPVLLGGNNIISPLSAIDHGDASYLYGQDIGALWVYPSSPRSTDTVDDLTTLTNTTETNLIAAGGTDVFLDLSFLLVSNHGTNANRVDIRDSSTGTIRLSLAVAGESVTRAFLPVGLPQATANNPWTAQLASTPTGGGADVNITSTYIRINT
jgi:hypothetical protein